MDPSDVQLIQRMRADETGEATRSLYRAYSGELFGFALNALGERGAAEEVVQEVFTRAWRHAGSYDPGRGSVRTWLYQIARHAIIDARRRGDDADRLHRRRPVRGTRRLGRSHLDRSPIAGSAGRSDDGQCAPGVEPSSGPARIAHG